MSIEREIVKKLFESKIYENNTRDEELEEASFESGGSVYKCVFGKYYKDGEPISRDDYFKAKEGNSGDTSANKSTTKSKSSSKNKKNPSDNKSQDVDEKHQNLVNTLRTLESDYKKAKNACDNYRRENFDKIDNDSNEDNEFNKKYKELSKKESNMKYKFYDAISDVMKYENKELKKVDWKNLELKPKEGIPSERTTYSSEDYTELNNTPGIWGKFVLDSGKGTHRGKTGDKNTGAVAIISTSGEVYMQPNSVYDRSAWAPTEKEMDQIKERIASGKIPRSRYQ